MQTTSNPDTGSDQLSMVVFSGDFDKILAAMIIALGAAAYDMKVNLFFTFWAINALRASGKKAEGKNFISKMFGFMMPKGPDKLALSKLQMAGAGPALIKSLMKKQGVASLPEMLKTAGELGDTHVFMTHFAAPFRNVHLSALVGGVDLQDLAGLEFTDSLFRRKERAWAGGSARIHDLVGLDLNKFFGTHSCSPFRLR